MATAVGDAQKALDALEAKRAGLEREAGTLTSHAAGVKEQLLGIDGLAELTQADMLDQINLQRRLTRLEGEVADRKAAAAAMAPEIRRAERLVAEAAAAARREKAIADDAALHGVVEAFIATMAERIAANRGLGGAWGSIAASSETTGEFLQQIGRMIQGSRAQAVEGANMAARREAEVARMAAGEPLKPAHAGLLTNQMRVSSASRWSDLRKEDF